MRSDRPEALTFQTGARGLPAQDKALQTLQTPGGKQVGVAEKGIQSLDTPADLGSLDIRVVTIDGEPWFVVPDVLRALGLRFGHGYGSSSQYLNRLLPDERRQLPASGEGESFSPPTNAVSESGLYKLLLRSDKPEALQVQDWVTREVLPAIRKDGA